MTLMRFWWALAVVLVLAALFLCLAPMPPVPESFDLGDKAWHILGHAGLALYFTGLVERRGWWKILVFLLAFGISVEFAQHFMNMGREGDWRDAIGNLVGDLSGLLLGWLGLSRWTRWAAYLVGRQAAS